MTEEVRRLIADGTVVPAHPLALKADRALDAAPARMAEYFPIALPFPRTLPIKTTDEFGAYARRIYASLGLGSSD
jgi:hypothetical protein